MSTARPFAPAGDSSPAAWVAEQLTDFAVNVLSLVPSGFETYARVFHPAEKVTLTEDMARESVSEPLSWAEVAALTGRTPHKLMEWPNIQGAHPPIHDYTKLEAGEVYVSEPEIGSLPLELAQTLWPIFEQHTSTPERCFFAIWERFGGMPKFIHEAPAFEIPARRFYLFEAPVQTVEQSLYTGANYDDMDESFVVMIAKEAILSPDELQEQLRASLDALNALPPAYQSANLWWPQDHAWFVYTEIDLNTTYIGGSQRLIDAIVQCETLETYQVNPTDELVRDTLNPVPDDPYGSTFKL